MSVYCYFNGQIMPIDEAKVGIKDIGILRGFGIYEAMGTASRRPFMFEDHMARYRRTADELHLKIPATEDEILAAINDLIARNVSEDKEATIKFFITGGATIHGIEYDYEHPTFFMLVDPHIPFESHYYTEGAVVTVFEHLRQFPQLKTTNYIQAVMLQQARKDAGAIEILYTWGGKVLECATSNFMIVKDGKIITAKEDILFGITRKVALDVARPLFTIEERDVSLDELYAADEAFLTSSFKDVMPVVKVGDKLIGEGRVGPVTKRVIELFEEYKKAY
ncbi:aminotransferase class IV [Candidatus Kaiserbacteria bacterium]|nr:aminotransferase class IV [Candidatus Kaiserbacteria bacterium]